MKAEIVHRTEHFVAQAFFDSHDDLDFISITHDQKRNEFVDKLYEQDGAYGFAKWLEKRVETQLVLDPEFSQFFANSTDLERTKQWMKEATAALNLGIMQYRALFSK